MSDTQNLTEQEMVSDIIEKYQGVIYKQKEMQYFIGQRVTKLIRGVMIFCAIMLLALFSAIIIFTTHIQALNNTITTMTKHFSTMTADVTAMNKSVIGMEKSVSHLPQMLTEIQTMQDNVGGMSNEITVLTEKMHKMQLHMNQITYNIDSMTSTFVNLEGSVHRMGNGVSRISRPMKAYNQFIPFN
ncbi:MAG: hypothetical protein OQL19_21595 [Gammaproteobacteria bacterium]|nr:hypothetical protein [Gammaproteobacteria bacterium]